MCVCVLRGGVNESAWEEDADNTEEQVKLHAQANTTVHCVHVLINKAPQKLSCNCVEKLKTLKMRKIKYPGPQKSSLSLMMSVGTITSKKQICKCWHRFGGKKICAIAQTLVYFLWISFYCYESKNVSGSSHETVRVCDRLTDHHVSIIDQLEVTWLNWSFSCWLGIFENEWVPAETVWMLWLLPWFLTF